MNDRETEIQFLRSAVHDYDEKALSGIGTGVSQPAPQKPCPAGARVVDLQKIDRASAPNLSFYDCTSQRCSRREYVEQPLSLYELGFILWCTQGIKKVIGGFRKYIKDGSGRNHLRPVPNVVSPFESYVAALNVEGLEQSVYRYLPLTHQLVFEREIASLPEKVADSFNNPMQNQDYVKKAGAVLYWSCVPYRAEWRNKDRFARGILIEIGHVSQNFYLATEALQCGCVALAGYIQQKADAVLGVDGQNEFTILCGAVGHVPDGKRDVYAWAPDLRAEANEGQGV